MRPPSASATSARRQLMALPLLAIAALSAASLAGGSSLGLRNGTLVVSNATCAPGPGEEAAFAAVLFAGAINNTGLAERAEYAQVRGGGLVIFTNVSGVLLTNSTLTLVNSTLQLFNTTLELWGSALELYDSRIELYDNSTLALYCQSTALGENRIDLATVSSPANNASLAAAGALGSVLGATDIILADEPYGDLGLVF
ncbi:hypothetical protein GPECTOR_24g176 [Gonium pectorale]|uniref:Right handed beta helix domain-containing protein n=1 Tax=Gonium pectorale TaxID=33097 RepID=A0A150GGC0_GONPE|nr:hypothetical protein GPECTOR_24g176 [Gonium pectorale]|eukprot:KXZ48887.1 hypothetical protein GPECTOR_24g176 [Gonium pectorale]